MTAFGTLLVVVVALALGLALAFYPLRAIVDLIARNVAVPIREFMQRQRERRHEPRETPDRRQVP